MDYNWNIKHSPKPPCMVSHYAHADVLRMKQNIEQSKTVYISVRKRTKTTLDINLYHGKDDFTVAHIPAGAEKFKFVEAYFDGIFSSSLNHYFRISKKQNLSELKEYLELVIAELNLSVDTLNVDMNIIGVEELKAA